MLEDLNSTRGTTDTTTGSGRAQEANEAVSYEDGQEHSNRCAHCGKSNAGNRCSRCKAAWYCDGNCQRSDWENHSAICMPASQPNPGDDDEEEPPPPRPPKSQQHQQEDPLPQQFEVDPFDDDTYAANVPTAQAYPRSASARSTKSGGSEAFLSPQLAASEVAPLQAAASKGNKRLVADILEDARLTGRLSEVINSRDVLGRTALVYAAVSGKVPVATLLIDSGAALDIADNEGRTALLWAVYYDKLKVVQLLLRKGCNPLVQDIEGHGVAHFCSRNQSLKVIQTIAKSIEGDPTRYGPGSVQELFAQPDSTMMTPLHWAAHNSAVDYVQLLLRYRAPLDAVDSEGKNPIHWAATKTVTLLKMLVDRASALGSEGAALINSGDVEGRTALHLAVGTGNVAAAVYLLSIPDCKVDTQDIEGRTPLHWAVQFGHNDMVGTLLKYGGTTQFQTTDLNGWSALHYAAHDGYADCIAELVNYEQVQDIPNQNGQTALMIAAMMGPTAIVQMLLDCGSDVNAMSTGGTALMAAALAGNYEICTLLLERGADVNAVDPANQSTLMMVCEVGDIELAALLAEAGGDLLAIDSDGRTVLHIAASAGHTDLCYQLLAAGLDPNAVDEGGRTPLHSAVYFNEDVNTTYALIEGGAYVDQQDSEGISAVHWAASRGANECLQVLLSANAFPNHTEYHEDRLTPLDYATASGHTETAQQLRDAGGLTIAEVRELAAQHIQSWWAGYQTRITMLAAWQKHLQEQADAGIPVHRNTPRRKPLSTPSSAKSRTSVGTPSRRKRIVPPATPQQSPLKSSDKPPSRLPSPSPSQRRAPSPSPSLNRAPSLPAIGSTTSSPVTASPKRKELAPLKKRPSMPEAGSKRKPSQAVPRLGYRPPKAGYGGAAGIKTKGKGARGKPFHVPTLRYYDDGSHTPLLHISARPSLGDVKESQGEGDGRFKLVEQKVTVAMTERRRVNLVRYKIDAARVIQRAYRRWVALGKPKPPVPPPMPPREWRSPKGAKVDTGLYKRQLQPVYPRFPVVNSSSVNNRKGGRFAQNRNLNHIRDTQETQIAALTIQLAWRKYLRRSGRSVPDGRQRRSRKGRSDENRYHLSPEVLAAKNQVRAMREYNIYTMPQPIMQWSGRRQRNTRTLKKLLPERRKLPSISVTAFNVALDTYFPPEVRKRFEKKRKQLLRTEQDADEILARASATKERLARLREEARGVPLPLKKLDPQSVAWRPLVT